MKVTKKETTEGVLQTIILEADDSEPTPQEFKNAVKLWINDKYTEMGWEEFFDRLAHMERNKVTLDMTQPEEITITA